MPDLTDEFALLLTKPLGTGVIMAAHMKLAARGEWVTAATHHMANGNGLAAGLMAPHRPMMTDVTGFGLARHALNLAERCGAPGAEISLRALPLMSGAQACLEDGHLSSLHDANLASVRVTGEAAALTRAGILFDPQLVADCLPPSCAERNFVPLPHGKRLYLVDCAPISRACSGRVSTAAMSPQSNEHQRILPTSMIIDVRSDSEYADDHIPARSVCSVEYVGAEIGTMYKQVGA